MRQLSIQIRCKYTSCFSGKNDITHNLNFISSHYTGNQFKTQDTIVYKTKTALHGTYRKSSFDNILIFT